VRGKAGLAAAAARPGKSSAGKRPARRPRRITASALPAHAAEVRKRLTRLYPDAHCELDHRNAWELLVATILSAQCTDRRVNMVTPHLFKAYPTPDALARAKHEEVEEIIRSTGFFRSKAKSIIGMAGAITDRHGRRVPRTMAELVTLPGVGRKTANVVLGNAYGVDEGIVVDTHVARLSQRLGLTKQTDPVRIEQDLMRLFPREGWTLLPHLLITHGRRICEAKKPRCEECALADVCPSARR
jgi:endonuclease-3